MPIRQCCIYFLMTLALLGCSSSHQPLYQLKSNALPPAPPLENIKIALVLSGGGARALAQAGVIDVLEENLIPIDLIVGSSSGSIIGALYADNPHSRHLRKKVIALKKWDLLDMSWTSGVKMLWSIEGPVQGTTFNHFVKKNIKAKHFSDLKIPLIAVTTDIHTGQVFPIRSGELAPALHASSAIPMLFAPVNIYGKVLVDGGVASPVPVDVAKEFSPKIIIAVDIGTPPTDGIINSTFKLGYRSLHISYYQLSQWELKQADVRIHPDVDKYSMFSDTSNAEMYRAGREAALKALPQIKALCKERGNLC